MGKRRAGNGESSKMKGGNTKKKKSGAAAMPDEVNPCPPALGRRISTRVPGGGVQLPSELESLKSPPELIMPRTKETKDKVGGLSGVRRSSPRAAAAALQGPEISDAGHMTEGEKFWRVSAAAAAEVVHSLRNKNDDDPALLEKDVMASHDNDVAKKTIELEEVNEDAEGVSADVDEKEQDGVVLKSDKAKTAPRGGVFQRRTGIAMDLHLRGASHLPSQMILLMIWKIHQTNLMILRMIGRTLTKKRKR